MRFYRERKKQKKLEKGENLSYNISVGKKEKKFRWCSTDYVCDLIKDLNYFLYGTHYNDDDDEECLARKSTFKWKEREWKWKSCKERVIKDL